MSTYQNQNSNKLLLSYLTLCTKVNNMSMIMYLEYNGLWRFKNVGD